MAEDPSGRVAAAGPVESSSPSTADMKSAIHETRRRLAGHLAQTANQVHLLFTAPSPAETEPPVSGVIAHAIRTIAVTGRLKRAWANAKRTGVLRGAAIAGVTVAIAAAFATRQRRR